MNVGVRRRFAVAVLAAVATFGATACAQAGSSPSGPASASGAAARDCATADLGAWSFQDDPSVIGSATHDFTIGNRSTSPCQLAAYPQLVYTEPGTRDVKPVPATRSAARQDPVLLAPGKSAAFTLRYAGRAADPSSLDCARPVSYRGMSLVLAGGQKYPLPEFGINVACDGVQIQPWRPVSRPEGAASSPAS